MGSERTHFEQDKIAQRCFSGRSMETIVSTTFPFECGHGTTITMYVKTPQPLEPQHANKVRLDVDRRSTYNEQEFDATDWRQEAFDNWSREILRLLPDRLNSAVKLNIHDERMLRSWREGAGTQLHDIVRASLEAISSCTS